MDGVIVDDPEHDIAVIKVTGKNLPYLILASADSGRCRSAFRAGADHLIRAMAISDSGGCRSVDHDRRKSDRDRPEGFPQGEVALDITEGKLFLRFDLRERQRADQKIVHAQD